MIEQADTVETITDSVEAAQPNGDLPGLGPSLLRIGVESFEFLPRILGGVFAWFPSMWVLGRSDWANRQVQELWGAAGRLPQELFLGLLGTINPWAKVYIDEETQNGFFAQHGKFLVWGENRDIEPGRVECFGRLITMINLRCADIWVGLFGAVAAIGTLGLFPKLNTAAAQGLAAPRLLIDCHYTAVGMLIPSATKNFDQY